MWLWLTHGMSLLVLFVVSSSSEVYQAAKDDVNDGLAAMKKK
jgi:hypothetical protein